MSATTVAFDVETTGKNPDHDQIIEISIVVEDETTGKQNLHRRFKPSVEISPGAQRVHGISMADLDLQPSIADSLDEIDALFRNADVVIGYNVRFDIRFLEKEFERNGRTIDLSSKLVVDPFRLWAAMEPRKLENAYARFAGQALTDAHSAEADTQAAIDVLAGMREAFGLQDTDWEELAGMCNPDRASWIGPTNHLRWEGEFVVVGFGKYDGRPLFDVAQSDGHYLRWIMDKDFPAHVKSLCKGALSGITQDAFRKKVAGYSPPPEAELSTAVT